MPKYTHRIAVAASISIDFQSENPKPTQAEMKAHAAEVLPLDDLESFGVITANGTNLGGRVYVILDSPITVDNTDEG